MPSVAGQVNLAASVADLKKALQTDGAGFTTTEAAKRLITYGPNSTDVAKGHPILRDLAASFANPLVIILLIAAILSGTLGEGIDSIIICAIVLVSIAINNVQTFRSRLAVQALQKGVSPVATVKRDGNWVELDRSKLVPGDLIGLAAGNMVPADCRLLAAKDLHVQEAALTGESLPVDKVVDLGALSSAQPSENSGSVFLGTSVVSGTGEALVVHTGKATAFGDIANRLAVRAGETDFEKGVRQFGVLIMKTVIFLVFFVFAVSILAKRDPFQSLLFSVALAVGLTPEFLPMITTITLSRGAVHMAKQGVIVKNLASIQNFGSMDILCSDKTGTLTTGKMTLDKSVDALGKVDESVLPPAQINSKFETGMKSPLDDAILAKGNGPQDAEKLAEIPFDFERRRMSVASWGVKNLLICKGAPESILPVCSLYRQGDQDISFDDKTRSTSSAVADQLGQNGYRVLAVAIKAVSSSADFGIADENQLTLIGYLGFIDPPLPDAKQAVQDMKDAGIAVKIISGDNQFVTAHVCNSVGLDASQIVTGDEIEKMTDSALLHIAEERSIFSRVSPAQKNRIITALRKRGHVVGYMGDGINDAPSLHAADVGISVPDAADVAKDAAEIILVRPGLGVLRQGVIEGRMAYGNVMKYLLMGTSSNFGNMFSMAAASLFLPFLPMLPTQILLNNFLYDLSQVTIPSDHVDPSFIKAPHRWDIGLIRSFMFAIGPISSLYDFLTFWVLLKLLHAGEKEFHTGWFVESLATQVLVILIIRTMGSPLKSRPSSPLLWTALAVVALTCAMPYLPFGSALGFVPLPPIYFVFLILTVITYLAVVEVVKRKLFAARLAA